MKTPKPGFIVMLTSTPPLLLSVITTVPMLVPFSPEILLFVSWKVMLLAEAAGTMASAATRTRARIESFRLILLTKEVPLRGPDLYRSNALPTGTKGANLTAEKIRSQVVEL